MVVGRISVGIIIFAIMLGIFSGYGRLDELPGHTVTLICVGVLLVIAYCVGSGVYLLVKAGVI